VEETDTPYVHPPEEKDDIPGNGLYCFLEQDRECNAECMAYITFTSESRVLNDQQKCCVFVVAADRIGMQLGFIAKIVKATADDMKRVGTKSPPDPMGG
jgi:hypothetical protein